MEIRKIFMGRAPLVATGKFVCSYQRGTALSVLMCSPENFRNPRIPLLSLVRWWIFKGEIMEHTNSNLNT